MMRYWMKISALALAGVLVVGQVQQASAFGGMLKKALQSTTTTSTQGSATTVDQANSPQDKPAAAPVNNGPVMYNNDKFGYKFELPGRWAQASGDVHSNAVSFFDENGNKGSFQVNANWMSEDFPVGASLQAMAKSYEERVKHAELVKYYRKDYTVKDKNNKPVAVFQGYVTIEQANDPDPEIRRMQWIGYAKGNYYNFTWAARPEQFEAYMPEFEQMMNKIQFAQ